jgi:hypothetical protein
MTTALLYTASGRLLGYATHAQAEAYAAGVRASVAPDLGDAYIVVSGIACSVRVVDTDAAVDLAFAAQARRDRAR